MEQIFTIHKTEKVMKRTKTVWTLEGQDGNSEYTSRTKVIIAFCREHPDDIIRVFSTTSDFDYTLSKTDGKWMLAPNKGGKSPIKPTSLLYAVRTLLSLQPADMENFNIMAIKRS